MTRPPQWKCVRRRGSVGLAALLVLTSVGCGTTATITSKDGSEYELEILRSTPGELIVGTRYGERAIPRAQIRDIDHPGNVLASVGAGLLLAGTAVLLSEPHCDGRSDFCVGRLGGTGIAGCGLVMFLFGEWIWRRSVNAASAPPPPPSASNF